MFYTILVKGNWVGEDWRVYQLAVSAKEARELAAQAKDDGKERVMVKSHHKPLWELTNYDDMVVKFSDGTRAIHPI